MAVFVALNPGENEAEENSQPKALQDMILIAFEQRMMCPGQGYAGGQQDERIKERQPPGIKHDNTRWRPHTLNRFPVGTGWR